jgi:hypothetical protein
MSGEGEAPGSAGPAWADGSRNPCAIARARPVGWEPKIAHLRQRESKIGASEAYALPSPACFVAGTLPGVTAGAIVGVECWRATCRSRTLGVAPRWCRRWHLRHRRLAARAPSSSRSGSACTRSRQTALAATFLNVARHRRLPERLGATRQRPRLLRIVRQLERRLRDPVLPSRPAGEARSTALPWEPRCTAVCDGIHWVLPATKAGIEAVGGT